MEKPACRGCRKAVAGKPLSREPVEDHHAVIAVEFLGLRERFAMDVAISPIRQAPEDRDGYEQAPHTAIPDLGPTIPGRGRETQGMDPILLNLVLRHLHHTQALQF